MKLDSVKELQVIEPRSFSLHIVMDLSRNRLESLLF